ncbi:hypothetical protein J1N35_020454 [Gossypium stocksii]|uniref:RRM domain-containing protein n=1 Tax=Gossypium stocksii TaxID=47602 RepID=A0A9D4A0D6_9ROSI|nr:hypothetical protein J1N35_020454 [Gossypium stocksii]
MCPMEHGVNHIVVEDVQSLSQFNLPVAVPTAKLLPTPAGPGALPSGVPPSTTLMNSKGLHSKSCKPGMTEEALGMNDTCSTSASGADLYDADQPLWNNNGLEASAALSGLHSPTIDETESLLNDDISDHHHGRLCDSTYDILPIKSTGLEGTNLSVWGRTGSSRSRINTKDKIDLTPLDCLANETKVEQKPTQKALHTLFVNGIPQKSNKREALLSHFRKFGEFIDIYIPLNSERAFVQFSRREEAEAALKAPDAVMGNALLSSGGKSG